MTTLHPSIPQIKEQHPNKPHNNIQHTNINPKQYHFRIQNNYPSRSTQQCEKLQHFNRLTKNIEYVN